MRSTMAPGDPLDQGKIALIEPARTTFTEILAWLAPPDYIIDGTQRIPEALPVPYTSTSDYYRFANAAYIPTRSLTAPEGTVILIYQQVHIGGLYLTEIYNPIQREDIAYQDNELFVYISKNNHTVIAVAAKGGSG